MGAIAGLYHIFLSQNQLNAPENTLLRRGPEGLEIQTQGDCRLYHSLRHSEDRDRFSVCKSVAGKTFSLVFSGNLYNRKELHEALKLPDPAPSAGELVLMAYLKWGKDCLRKLNGIFTFAVLEWESGRLFLARDPMGIRPLFYRIKDQSLIFASEIKTILAVPGVRAELNAQGAMELIMLGPGRMPGSGVFHGIEELKPGYYAVYENGKLNIEQYWHLTDGIHEDSFLQTAEKVRWLLLDAVKRQTEGVHAYGTLLSGGLDSSILSAVCKKQNPCRKLKTFSVDYLHNEQYFEPGKFQPDSDDPYIRQMCSLLHSRHRTTVLTPEDLEITLEDAMLARDLPGMGDVDSSLLAFCREVRKQVPMVLSGECADEIFGGYPWYRDQTIRQQEGFPWAQNLSSREKLLAIPMTGARDFVMDAYHDTCLSADIAPECRGEDRRIKELVVLNMQWFMQTLVDRNDRLSAAAGLEVRVPFCDVRIAEYLYRVPWAMKDHEGREKGLLRYAVKGLIPESVRLRKKSPYPKTFDPVYSSLAERKIRDLLRQDLPLWQLVSRKTAESFLQDGLASPWYGQLMGLPQFCAWLLQANLWLEHYKVNFLF